MPGRHNVLNALAAVAVGLEFRLADEVVAKGFERFSGVKRRFTRVGEIDGAAIVDDYAAPSGRDPLGAVGGTRRGRGGRVIAVVQPHRYTRLHNLMEDFQNAFNDADVVFVAPVYAAGEEPIEGVDASALADGLRSRGHRMVKTVDGPGGTCRQSLRDLAADGDLIICMGAGDITKWAGGPGRRNRQGEEVEVTAAAVKPAVRGKLKADAPLAPLVWFKSGGNAELLFEPADREDLVRLSERARSRYASHGAWPRLQHDRSRWRRAGRDGAAGQGIFEDRTSR